MRPEGEFLPNCLKKAGIYRVAYQKGRLNKVGFVFSCPGEKEKAAGHVCAGVTGENLKLLLAFCQQKRPDIFASNDKEDYLITNASDCVHYKKLTNDTEPSTQEMLCKSNMERLKEELNGIELIIAMGKKPASIICKIPELVDKMVVSKHLSPLGLNQIKVKAETSTMRNRQRLEIVAEDIINKILTKM